MILDINGNTVDVSKVVSLEKVDDEQLNIECLNGFKDWEIVFDDEDDRDEAYDKLFNLISKKEKSNQMDSFKQYVEKHRDVFFTIIVVIALDHFIFGGAFRDKLKSIIDSFLDKKVKEIGK